MFLPLVTRLVNDQSSKCRTAVAACVATLLRRVTPSRRDRLVAYCLEWIRGTEPRLVRASAQTLGILVDVEGSGVGRRMPEVMGKVAAVLQHCVQLDESATEDDDGKGSNGAALSEEAAPGWQEAYYSTVLLEKAMAAVPAQLAWGACDASPACWTATKHLLLHRHLWVRKAAGRLLGAGLADSGVGPAMLTSGRDATAPGALALGFLRQMDSPSADEALAAQAVKCLVFLTEPMYQADAASGRVPGSSWSCAQNGKKGADDSAVVGDEANADEEEERAEDDAAAEAAAGCLSLQGLVRRMVRLADDKSFVRQAHRATALRFIAAMASRLGPVKVKPYLPVLLRPLYRITEPGATGNSEEVKTLADEIVGHLRSLVGADSLLAAYNAAREAVRAQRGERKQRAAVQALVDPEAAAKRKLRVAERKAAGKKRALEEVRRMRSAGVVVKNKGAGGRRGQRQ